MTCHKRLPPFTPDITDRRRTMIQTEQLTIDGANFVRTYSDEGRFVVRDGIRYREAIDPIEYASERTYAEGDIIPEPEPTDADYAEAGRILLGGDA